MSGPVSMPALSTPGVSASDLASGASAAKGKTPKAPLDDKAIDKAAKDFEGQFVSRC